MRTADGAAKTRENAIQGALRELDLELSDIEKIEILDEGSRGILGFGARDVKVRLHAEDLPEERPRRGDRSKRGDRGPRREGRGRDGKGPRKDGSQKGDRSARSERDGGQKGDRPSRNERDGNRKGGQSNRKDRQGPRKERQARGEGNGSQEQNAPEQKQAARDDSKPSESRGRGNRSNQRDDKQPKKGRAPYKVDVSTEAKKERSEGSGGGSSSRRGREDRQERDARPKRQPRRERPERKRERPPLDAETAKTMGNAAAALLQEVIAKMGMESTVSSEVGTDGDILLNVESKDSAILIGRKGRNLSAMQFLLNRMTGNTEEGENFDRIVVDVEGYLARRRTSLEEMALGLAQKAKDTGRSMRVKPLNPQERRIIHLTLENDTELRTFSLGSSLHRRVVIVPNNAEDNGRGNDWDAAEDVDFDAEVTESLSSEQDDS